MILAQNWLKSSWHCPFNFKESFFNYLNLGGKEADFSERSSRRFSSAVGDPERGRGVLEKSLVRGSPPRGPTPYPFIQRRWEFLCPTIGYNNSHLRYHGFQFFTLSDKLVVPNSRKRVEFKATKLGLHSQLVSHKICSHFAISWGFVYLGKKSKLTSWSLPWWQNQPGFQLKNNRSYHWLQCTCSQ